MNAVVRRCALLLLLTVVGGCGSDDGLPEQSDADDKRALEQSAFGDLTSTIDRAREVEDLAGQRKRQLDDSLDDQAQ